MASHTDADVDKLISILKGPRGPEVARLIAGHMRADVEAKRAQAIEAARLEGEAALKLEAAAIERRRMRPEPNDRPIVVTFGGMSREALKGAEVEAKIEKLGLTMRSEQQFTFVEGERAPLIKLAEHLGHWGASEDRRRAARVLYRSTRSPEPAHLLTR